MFDTLVTFREGVMGRQNELRRRLGTAPNGGCLLESCDFKCVAVSVLYLGSALTGRLLRALYKLADIFDPPRRHVGGQFDRPGIAAIADTFPPSGLADWDWIA